MKRVQDIAKIQIVEIVHTAGFETIASGSLPANHDRDRSIHGSRSRSISDAQNLIDKI